MGTAQHSLEAVLLAVERGNTVTGIAKILGVSRNTVYLYRKRWKSVDEAIIAKQDELVDLAESGLRLAVIHKEPWAVAFTLKTLGRRRGYVERQELTGADGKDLVPKRNADDYSDDELAAIIAGRRGAGAPEEASGSE